MPVDEHTIDVAGTPVFYRSASIAAGSATPVYLHGIPTSADDWTAPLERTGGIAVDLLGFGRSGKGGHLDFRLPAQVSFLEAVLAELGVERIRLVGHDWGAAVGLALAEQGPERIDRVALCNPLPAFERFALPPLLRRIRRIGVGELIMGSTPRWMFARTLRSGCADPGSISDERLNSIWEQFDQGTQRAILRIYRSLDRQTPVTDRPGLAAIAAPALILWGERDPWLAPELAAAFAERLPGATIERLPGAGHWPWFDDPEVVERIASFVSE